jgi:hypothetical protein
MSEWGHCSVCTGDESGMQLCMRSVLIKPHMGGKACGPLAKTRPCEAFDCRVGPWHDCSPCSATCGSSEKLCLRDVVAKASVGGRSCPALRKARSCKVPSCPDDCVVSPWEAWSPCSQSCRGSRGFGSMSRIRSIIIDAASGGAVCPHLIQKKTCNMHSCPQDCRMGAWQPWTACFATCGGGHRTRRRSIIAKPAGGGRECGTGDFVHAIAGRSTLSIDGTWRRTDLGSIPLVEAQPCNTRLCPIDCAFSPSVCGECTKSCGGGSQVSVTLHTVSNSDTPLVRPLTQQRNPSVEMPA